MNDNTTNPVPTSQSASSEHVKIQVPTTKILAIGHLTTKGTDTERRAIMDYEVPATVRLYLSGKMDQWYSTTDSVGVVFMMNVTEIEDARQLLAQLPLSQAGMMHFELTPIGPLNPLNLLLKQ